MLWIPIDKYAYSKVRLRDRKTYKISIREFCFVLRKTNFPSNFATKSSTRNLSLNL